MDEKECSTRAVVTVIIPALNEEENIAKVIGDLPRERINRVIVVDNGSADGTARAAESAGAEVAHEPDRGYGAACMKGLHLAAGSDVIVFVDGDYSDYPEEAALLLDRLAEGYDMVVGSRMTGKRERGALPIHSLIGNWLVSTLINISCGTSYTDLGPFRAVRYNSLMSLGMKDRNYGWTVEMAMRAAGAGWRCCEVPVRYRKRFSGKSKVTGSLSASVKTAFKMLSVFVKLSIQLRKEKRNVG